MEYAKTKSFNGKDGWIVTVYGSSQPNKETVEIPNDTEPKKPSDVKEAPRWDGEKVVIEETGANIPPEPDEAKQRLLTKAETPESEGGWGWSRSEVRTLRTDYALMFDFIDAKNYEEAKNEADHAESQGDITTSQLDYIHDLLDGKV
jgi:hypothetical protein